MGQHGQTLGWTSDRGPMYIEMGRSECRCRKGVSFTRRHSAGSYYSVCPLTNRRLSYRSYPWQHICVRSTTPLHCPDAIVALVLMTRLLPDGGSLRSYSCLVKRSVSYICGRCSVCGCQTLRCICCSQGSQYSLGQARHRRSVHAASACIRLAAFTREGQGQGRSTAG